MNQNSSTKQLKTRRRGRFMMRDIYISFNLNLLTKLTSNSRSTEFKYILPQNISQMISKTISINKINRISHFEFVEKSMETETTT